MGTSASPEQLIYDADRIYIKKFNEEHRISARVVCSAVIFILLIFAFWDMRLLGTDHPELLSVISQRLVPSIPFALMIILYSYQPVMKCRLDLVVSTGGLLLGMIMAHMHFLHLRVGMEPSFDSILLCVFSVYFLPNIFYIQKFMLGSMMLVLYYTGLYLHDQPVSEYISSGIYIFGINAAGMIHSHSYDKHRRENYNQNQFLKAMANTDQLTGVGNRHKFDERFSKLLNIAREENKGIAIAIADIDFFKQYNDNYGHLAGDECLIQVAQALLSMKRHPLDNCIRFGGEEFILIKYGINADECQAWGEKIKEAIYRLDFPHAHSSIDNRVTISAGVIHWAPNSALTRTELMKFADDALYRAKESGRNKVEVHHHSHNG